MNPEADAGEVKVEKLLIDRPSDFKFHAAYLVYSELWDKAKSQEVKTQLNQMVSLLSKDEIDYETFYRNISQYRSESYAKPSFYTSKSIETQRKRDWREREARKARNERHKR
ncbi:MAG: hypothetical protein ACQXXH_03015 [Candidatus Bathyarchaeia archaeon]|jgi:uncharacterized protein YdiU (UPF0061 family)|nr:hypothetical protein [Candidatus Bathyarchaeota archaeon A05DMB-4]MDH7594714.1 hypothetical protein [Candidatus Bathyarchaeota archaeon]